MFSVRTRENTPFIGMKGSVSPLRRVAFNFAPSFFLLLRPLGGINDALSVFPHLYACRQRVYGACMLFIVHVLDTQPQTGVPRRPAETPLQQLPVGFKPVTLFLQ